MGSNRINRIDFEIKKELSKIIMTELSDHYFGTIITVSKVQTTTDLSICKVHISVLGEEKIKKDVIDRLNKSKGYFRKIIATNINLRVTPEFIFILDETLEYGIKMTKLIDEVVKPIKEKENE